MDPLNPQTAPSRTCQQCSFSSVERCAVTGIAWLTILTGSAQILIPQKMLPLLAITPDLISIHLFATIGMFMVLFGSAVIHAQRQPKALDVVMLWAALQKLGASLFVAWGVSKGTMAPLALLVASFDFLSALLFSDYRCRIKKDTAS